MDGQPEVPEEAEALFGLDPAEFVGARDALASRLRRAGHVGTAEVVRSLRRPTVPADALNRVARSRPALIESVEAAGAELARSQRRTLSGVTGVDLRAAVRAQAAAVEEVLEAVEPPVGADARAALRQTLLALAVDADLAGRVRRGVLSRPGEVPDASAALGLGGPLRLVRDAVADTDPDPSTVQADQLREARRRVEQARQAMDASIRRLDARTVEEVASARRVRRTRTAAEVTAAAVVVASAALEEAEQRVARAREGRATAEAAAVAAMGEARDVVTTDQAAQAAVRAARDEVDVARSVLERAEADLTALDDPTT